MTRVLGTPIERTTHGWRAVSLRAYVVESRGVPFDGRVSPLGLFGPGTWPAHSYVTIPLDGEYVSLRDGSVVVRPGDALVEHTLTWEERWERDLRALVIQWAVDHGRSTAGELRLSPEDLAHARAIADLMVEGGEDDPWLALAPFLERLRALGVGIAPTAEIELPEVPPDVLRIEQVMSVILTTLERGPGSVDLSAMTGLSERHLRRLFAQHVEWLGSFRSRIQHARLPSAANWLTFSDLPTEKVARSLGYGSARALMRALDDAGYGGRETIRRRTG